MVNQKFIKRLTSNKIFSDNLLSKEDLLNFEYSSPFTYFNYFWSQYTINRDKFIKLNSTSNKDLEQSFRSTNGAAFETILTFLLEREKISIDSMDEKVENVKLVKPDFIIKAKNYNIFLSLKTTIRERWKQADWEALKYKISFPTSKCFLLVNNEYDSKSIKSKLSDLDIDDVIYANSKDLDSLIQLIKSAYE